MKNLLKTLSGSISFQNTPCSNIQQFNSRLNYLNQDLLKRICPTDTRLRPDQRALEFGNVELAREEKHRLE